MKKLETLECGYFVRLIKKIQPQIKTETQGWKWKIFKKVNVIP